MNNERILIYLIGAKGNIGVTTAIGLHALTNSDAQPTGMVSMLSDFATLDLPALSDFVVAGADPAEVTVLEKAKELAEGRVVKAKQVGAFAEEAVKLNGRIDDGIDIQNEAYSVDELIVQVKDAVLAATVAAGADRTIVINVGATEASPELGEAQQTFEALRWHVQNNQRRFFTNAMIYALGAGRAGAAYVNFTPSMGAEIPAIASRFEERKLPCAGKDGKTGETLLKTVLAPMFVSRNFKVMSWLANNYLGNSDGETLSDADARTTKLASKDEALKSILGDQAHVSTDIGYAPSLNDWKTAWDLIHFEGFLGTQMTMQFTWQGCDSTLAAPLVLDLARFVAYAWKKEDPGPYSWLAPFFKSPMGCDTHEFFAQMQKLKLHLKTLG